MAMKITECPVNLDMMCLKIIHLELSILMSNIGLFYIHGNDVYRDELNTVRIVMFNFNATLNGAEKNTFQRI